MSHTRLLSSPHLLLLCLVVNLTGALTACRNEDEKTPSVDMSSSMDMPQEDMPADASMDMPDADTLSDQDTVPADQGVDADMGEPLDLAEEPDLSDMNGAGDMRPTCERECATHALTIEFGANTRSLGRAMYGLSSPEQSVNGEEWEIYVESLEGGYSGCTQELSPSPDYTFILSGLPILMGGEVLSKETDQINAILFDYEGDLVPDPPFRTVATEVRVTARTTSVCTDCVGMMAGDMDNSDPNGFVSLEVEAIFPEGSVKGMLYAEHCDSLDAK